MFCHNKQPGRFLCTRKFINNRRANMIGDTIFKGKIVVNALNGPKNKPKFTMGVYFTKKFIKFRFKMNTIHA